MSHARIESTDALVSANRTIEDLELTYNELLRHQYTKSALQALLYIGDGLQSIADAIRDSTEAAQR